MTCITVRRSTIGGTERWYIQRSGLRTPGERPMLSRISRTLAIAAASALLLTTVAEAGGGPQRKRSADTSRSTARAVQTRVPRAKVSPEGERDASAPVRTSTVTNANIERGLRAARAKCDSRERDCTPASDGTDGG